MKKRWNSSVFAIFLLFFSTLDRCISLVFMIHGSGEVVLNRVSSSQYGSIIRSRQNNERTRLYHGFARQIAQLNSEHSKNKFEQKKRKKLHMYTLILEQIVRDVDYRPVLHEVDQE